MNLFIQNWKTLSKHSFAFVHCLCSVHIHDLTRSFCWIALSLMLWICSRFPRLLNIFFRCRLMSLLCTLFLFLLGLHLVCLRLCRRWNRVSPTLMLVIRRCIVRMCCLIDPFYRMNYHNNFLDVFALHRCISFQMFCVYFRLNFRLLFVRFIVFLYDYSHVHKNLLQIPNLTLIHLLSYYDCQDA